jgi:hypothetical protein
MKDVMVNKVMELMAVKSQVRQIILAAERGFMIDFLLEMVKFNQEKASEELDGVFRDWIK